MHVRRRCVMVLLGLLLVALIGLAAWVIAQSNVEVSTILGKPAGDVVDTGCLQFNQDGRSFACDPALTYDSASGTLYVPTSLQIGGVGGVVLGGRFTNLSDVPSSYAGAGSYCVAVNSAATALEFVPCTGGGSGGASLSQGTTFPASPVTDDLFLVTDDSAPGVCDSLGGTSRTLCYWDGDTWTAALSDNASGGTLDQAFDLGPSIDGAVSLATAVRIGGPTHAWRHYQDGAGALRLRACDSDGSDCITAAKQLEAGSDWELVNEAGTTCGSFDSLTMAWTPSSTGSCAPNLALTTYNVEASGHVFTDVTQVHLPFARCVGGVAALLWDDNPMLTAPSAACNAGTNRVAPTANFDDAADEGFASSLDLPTGWTGVVDVAITWRAVATTGAVSWGIWTSCYADGEAPDPAPNTIQYTSTTVHGTTLRRTRTSFSSITMTGCAATERLTLVVFRDGNGTGGTDSLSGDALAEAVTVTMRLAK